MTSAVVTPSGVPTREYRDDVLLRAVRSRRQEIDITSYRVHLPAPAPPELRVRLEFGREEHGVWAHIPELDISAEGADVSKAFTAVIAASRTWLTYLRDGDEELGPELRGQERYVALLDAPIFSWFRDFDFAE